MTNQIFDSIGVYQPLSAEIGDGATVFPVNNTTDSAAYSKGQVMQLVPSSSDDITGLTTNKFGFIDITMPTAPANTDAGSNLASRCFCVLLEDIADDGRGLVLVRGLVAAFFEANSAAIDNDDALYVGDGGAANTLANVEDLTANETVKVIALARNSTQFTSGTPALKPCLFDGISGFGMVQGV